MLFLANSFSLLFELGSLLTQKNKNKQLRNKSSIKKQKMSKRKRRRRDEKEKKRCNREYPNISNTNIRGHPVG